jgi:EmrB/QacA subfamily drug resistance transporter
MPESRRRQLALVATILGSGIALLDATIVTVALPAIEDDLGGGLAGQQWVANAYLLTLGSLILIGGSLGDLYGARRVFALGVAAFGASSVLCALAPTIETLVVARALQGATGALLVPASLAVIAVTFAEEERGAAIGSWTAWGGIAAVIGPLAGGQIVDLASWRWIFAVNVPLVLVTIALIYAAIDAAAPHDGRRRVDVAGAALCALGLAGPVFALIEEPDLGWGHPAVWGSLLGGTAVFALFLLWEVRSPVPMLPLGLFRRRNFSVTNAETLLVYGALSSLFFFLVIFLQEVAGYSALESGLAGMPVTVLLFALSRRFGALSARYGSRLFMGAGPVVAAVGALTLVRLDESVSYVTDVLPGMVVFGVGLAITVAPLTTTVLADVEPGRSGIASGVNNAVARVAGLLGIAVIGVAVAGRSGSTLDVGGLRIAIVLIAALLAAGGLIGFAGIRNVRRLAPV